MTNQSAPVFTALQSTNQFNDLDSASYWTLTRRIWFKRERAREIFSRAIADFAQTHVVVNHVYRLQYHSICIFHSMRQFTLVWGAEWSWNCVFHTAATYNMHYVCFAFNTSINFNLALFHTICAINASLWKEVLFCCFGEGRQIVISINYIVHN